MIKFYFIIFKKKTKNNLKKTNKIMQVAVGSILILMIVKWTEEIMNRTLLCTNFQKKNNCKNRLIPIVTFYLLFKLYFIVCIMINISGWTTFIRWSGSIADHGADCPKVARSLSIDTHPSTHPHPMSLSPSLLLSPTLGPKAS